MPAPARSNCKCCNQSCENHLLVICSVCKDKFKHTCVDITLNEVRVLNANKGYEWTCVTCRAVGKDLKDLKSLYYAAPNYYYPNTKQQEAEKVQSSNVSACDFEEIVSETTERVKRKKNIVVFNVDEPDQSKQLKQQVEADTNMVGDIVKYVAPSLPQRNIKTTRLGHFNSLKKRPIKITLGDTVRKILSNANKLRNHNDFKQVIPAPDRIKRQIDYYRSVKQELMERRNAGETNCVIKYINDVPRIITLN
nr:unnamed protein product [Callosobruchus analis]